MAEKNDKDVDVIKELNDLKQLDYDAAKTYEEAISHIKEIEIKEDLEIFRRDHLRHMDELTIVIRTLGGEAKEVGRDIKGALLEGMTKLRSVTGTEGALKAMRMNEKVTNKSYDEASKLELPENARELVLRNLADERRHLATIEMHLDRLAGAQEEEGAEVPEVVEVEEEVVIISPEPRPGAQ
jgi:rubrerythrin